MSHPEKIGKSKCLPGSKMLAVGIARLLAMDCVCWRVGVLVYWQCQEKSTKRVAVSRFFQRYCLSDEKRIKLNENGRQR